MTTSRRIRGHTSTTMKARLLVAMEDARAAEHLQGALRPPFSVDHVKDGLEVMDRVLSRKPAYSALVLDEGLSWLDGVTLLRILRALRVMTPGVLLSDRRIAADEAASVGMTVTKRKGINAAELRAAVTKALSTPVPAASRPPPPWHVAAFMEEERLDEVAAEFMGSGAERVALVTTRDRAKKLCHAAGISFTDIHFVDVDHVMTKVLELKSTDSVSFDRLMAALIEEIHKQFGWTRFRLHGDLVSHLLARKKHPWALAVEYAWHRQFAKHSFSCICGYRLADVRSSAGWVWVPDLAGRHSFAMS